MDSMRDIVVQEMNEQRYNRRHIDGYIRDFIRKDLQMQAKMEQGIDMVHAYMEKTYYASKMARIAQLKDLDIPTLVEDIFIGVAYYVEPELFTSVSAQMAGRLHFSDKTEAITTMAEIMAVLCQTDAFDIFKANKMASLALVSRIPLPQSLLTFIAESQYLPPMVCEPLPLESNFDSGYLTHKDSLILGKGKGNHHDGDICLDTLNLANKVALKLDTDFLSQVEETPTFALDTPEKAAHWHAFKKQSYAFYSLIANQGNRFFLTHKVDKRGRMYAQGYHISTEGTSFKKAMIELYKEELVQGVP